MEGCQQTVMEIGRTGDVAERAAGSSVSTLTLANYDGFAAEVEGDRLGGRHNRTFRIQRFHGDRVRAPVDVLQTYVGPRHLSEHLTV